MDGLVVSIRETESEGREGWEKEERGEGVGEEMAELSV